MTQICSDFSLTDNFVRPNQRISHRGGEGKNSRQTATYYTSKLEHGVEACGKTDPWHAAKWDNTRCLVWTSPIKTLLPNQPERHNNKSGLKLSVNYTVRLIWFSTFNLLLLQYDCRAVVVPSCCRRRSRHRWRPFRAFRCSIRHSIMFFSSSARNWWDDE